MGKHLPFRGKGIVITLFVFAPPCVGNAQLLYPIIQRPRSNPEFSGGVFLDPQVFFQGLVDQIFFLFFRQPERLRLALGPEGHIDIWQRYIF